MQRPCLSVGFGHHRLRTYRGAVVDRLGPPHRWTASPLLLGLRRLPQLLRDLLAVILHPARRLVLRKTPPPAGKTLRGTLLAGLLRGVILIGHHLPHTLPVLYQEEAHSAFIHEPGELVGGNDRIAAREPSERDYWRGLIGVQDDRGRAHGVCGSNQVPGVAPVGLKVVHQYWVGGITASPGPTSRSTTRPTPGRSLNSLGTGGPHPPAPLPRRVGGPRRGGDEKGQYPYGHHTRRVNAYVQPWSQAQDDQRHRCHQAQPYDHGR